MNVFRGVHRRVPRRSMFAATAAATAVAVAAGVAVWLTVKPADAATVQPGSFTGLGFDACTAPSNATMDAWRLDSPYRAVGIYFGGVGRGCAQPNLTPAWVDRQQAAGWHLIPLYVGLQASCGPANKPFKIDNTRAAIQGREAAADAVVQATTLGLARNSLLIYDMEAYDTSDAVCRAGVLAFMSAWTIRLHESGYASGFYSSVSSGVADQVTNYSAAGYVRPDYVDFARWDTIVTTADTAIPAAYWTPHRRIKQYRGGHIETWGGVSINIDNDYLDVVPMAATPYADFTGNGFADVLARNSTSGALYLHAGHASTVQGAVTIGSGWSGMNAILRIGDLNRDGREDVVARQASNGVLWFYPGTSAGLGARKQIGTGWNSMRELTAIGDFTGDGVPDLMAVQRSTNLLFVYAGRSTAALGAKRQVGTGWSAMGELAGVGDFDRNGHPDFVARVTATGVLNFYRGLATGFTGRQVGTGWQSLRDLVGVGDFDRDGFNDLAAVRTSDGALLLYRGNGVRFTNSVPIGAGFGTRSPVF